MFMWLVEPCLDFIHHHCKAIVQTSSIHLTHSLMKLYTCLLGKYPKSQSFYSFFFFFFSLLFCNKMKVIRCKEFPCCFRSYDTSPFSQISIDCTVLWLAYRAFAPGRWCHYRAARGLVSIFHMLCVLSAGI